MKKKMTRQNTFYERNKHTIEKSSTPIGLVFYTNIAAVSLLPIWLPWRHTSNVLLGGAENEEHFAWIIFAFFPFK